MSEISNKNRKQESIEGFSLAEIIVVVGILALATGFFALNNSYNSDTRKLKLKASQVQNLIKRAKNNAIQKNVQTAVFFNRATRTFQTSEKHANVVFIPNEMSVQIQTGSSLIKNNKASIQFFPDGTASGGNISLENRKAQITITIPWLVGRVTQNVRKK